MTRSSPARRSQFLSSPDRSFLSNFLSDDRNNEDSHLDALAAAQIQHERVREAAIRVYELHELQEKRKRILEEQKKEEDRIKAEEESAAEARRLNELRAKSVPKPPLVPAPQPEPQKQPEPKPQAKLEAPKPAPPKLEPAKQPAQGTGVFALATSTPSTQVNGLFAPKPAQPTPPAPVTQSTAKTNGVFPSTASTNTGHASSTASGSPRRRLADRYAQIHQELKKLRKHLMDESKRPDSPLKGKVGQARREVRTAIGQLTGTQGSNSQHVRSRESVPVCGKSVLIYFIGEQGHGNSEDRTGWHRA